MKKIGMIFLSIILVIFCGFTIFLNIKYELGTVVGTSMEPTLVANDRILIEKNAKKFNRFDIISFEIEEEQLVKRIIGLPGDKIKYCYQNGKTTLLINDIEVKESFYYSEWVEYFKEATIQDFVTNEINVLVPEGCYYVLGDNRFSSKDSRTFGYITEKQIIGKVIYSGRGMAK